MEFNIESITLEQFRQLIASGDDNHPNQIRVTKTGKVYLSQDIVGAAQLDNIAFRFETTDAHNGYVGEEASKDDSYIKPIFNALKGNWEQGVLTTYVDDFLIRDYGKYC